ncbi:MAG: hypothetical protein GXY98_04790 [Erysipelothrix sp.]|nr:hypothetical protein [Erysipelothrix sp.]
MKLFKKIIVILIIMTITVGCTKETEEPSVIPNPTPEDPVIVEPKIETYPLPLFESKELQSAKFTLTLEVKDKKTSQVVGVIENFDSKTIKNVKVTLHYNQENDNRILYYANEVKTNEISDEFRIMGPLSNQPKDIVVKEIYIEYDDASTQVLSNKDSEVPITPSEPVDPSTPVETTKSLDLYRFGNFILEAADTVPNFGISENKVIMTVQNNTLYPITTYSLVVNLNGVDLLFEVKETIAPGALSSAVSHQLSNADLSSIIPVRLFIEADYSPNRTIEVNYSLSGDYSASYKLIIK